MPGISSEANTLLDDLTAGLSFDIPVIDFDGDEFKFPTSIDSDLYKQIAKLKNEDLTTRTIGGDGAFDAIMASVHAHLKGEYDANRITGAEYTKAYLQLTSAALGSAVQFLLGKDQAYWSAQSAQLGAFIARTQLEAEKLRAAQAQIEAHTVKVNYGVTKANLVVVSKQAEAQNAQTSDTKLDGVTDITGSIGQQIKLYGQQITSYQRDAEMKAAKIFSDAWITQKTIDEGLTAPGGFTNASLNEVLVAIRQNNNIPVPADEIATP